MSVLPGNQSILSQTVPKQTTLLIFDQWQLFEAGKLRREAVESQFALQQKKSYISNFYSLLGKHMSVKKSSINVSKLSKDRRKSNTPSA